MSLHVLVTQALRSAFERKGIDPALFATAFERWKTNWPLHEHDSLHFGKDAFYRIPAVDGQYNFLRHAHLRPVQDRAAAWIWDVGFRLGKRKTSDRVLVYVHDHRADRYLLIFILDEPTAHATAAMRTVRDRILMENLAAVAAAFMDDGRVIA